MTGWKVSYILDGVNYQTLMMMLADAPRYVRKRSAKNEGKSAEAEALEIAGYFRSRLK